VHDERFFFFLSLPKLTQKEEKNNVQSSSDNKQMLISASIHTYHWLNKTAKISRKRNEIMF
jgi:hypothetical protein